MLVKPLYLNNLGQHTETNELIWDDVLKVLYAKGQIRQDFVKSSLLKTDSNGFLVPAVLGTDYVNYSYKNSITLDSNALQLVNDSSSPGNNKLYGTNSSGIRGWYNIPTSGITTEVDPVFTAHTVYNIIDGTGFLKNDGSGNWSYDTSTYVTGNIYTTDGTVTSNRILTGDNKKLTFNNLSTFEVANYNSDVSNPTLYTSKTVGLANRPISYNIGVKNELNLLSATNTSVTSFSSYRTVALENRIYINDTELDFDTYITGSEHGIAASYNHVIYQGTSSAVYSHNTVIQSRFLQTGNINNHYELVIGKPIGDSTNFPLNWWGLYAPDDRMKNHINGKTFIGGTYDFGNYKLQVHGDVSMGSSGGYMAYFKPSNNQIILEGSVSTKFSIDGLYSGYSYGSIGFASDFSTFMSNGGLQATNAGGWFKSVTPLSVKKNMIMLSPLGIGFYAGMVLDTDDDFFHYSGYSGGFDLLGNFRLGFSITHTNLAKLDVYGSIRQTSVTSSLVRTDSNGIFIAAIEGTVIDQAV